MMLAIGVSHLTALELAPVPFVRAAGAAGFAAVGLRLAPAHPRGLAYPTRSGTTEHRALRDVMASEGVETWTQVLAVNLNGVFHGCRVAAPHMKARGWGRILNIASMAGNEGVPFISSYSAAKAGVIGFSKALAKELAGDGVTVNCIAPAMAETGLMAQMTPEHIASMKARIPMGRFLQVAEVADMAAWIISDECSFTTGFTFDLSGGRATY